jgi:DNA-binding transcriptional regulator YiaG
MARAKKSKKSAAVNEWLVNICGKVNANDVPRDIESLRTHLSMTQAEFGKLFGVTHAAVSSWESGNQVPSSETFVKLGNLAHYPTSIWFWCLGGVDPERILASFSYFLDRADLTTLPKKTAAEISTKTAARILRITHDEVLKLIRAGEIESRLFGPNDLHLVSYDSVVHLANARRSEKKAR